MNKSSFLSQNSQKNTSSFLNDSINTSKQCCQYKQKYQLLYKQMSQIRIQLRGTKQQNNTLRSTLKGTQQQNSTLKGLLSTKKQLINKLNYEIRESNQEINRLQDYNHILMNSNKEEMTKKLELSDKIKQIQSILKREKEEKIAVMQRVEQKQRQIMKNKQYYEGIQKNYKLQNSKTLQGIGRIVNQQIQSIVDIFMRSNKSNIKNIEQQSKVFKTNSPDACLQQTKILNPSPLKNQPKSNPKLKFSKKLENPQPLLNLNSLQSKLLTLNKQIQQKNNERQQLIQTQKSQIKSYKQRLQNLQNQLQQSMQLFQQQLNDINSLKSKLKQRQLASSQNERQVMQKNSQKDELLRYINKKLISILQNAIVHDNIDVFNKLNLMIQESNVKKFELQVLLRQVQIMAEHNFKETIKVNMNNNNLQKITRQYNQISQEYELISLKYSTLQRQYNQILEDNHRLIKFNHLSKFRINRNILSPCKDQEFHSQSNKTPIHHLENKIMTPNLIKNKQNQQTTINK